MRKYRVFGMSCAACSARVERAVSAVDGVESCTVSLLTSSMTVSGDVDERLILDAVLRAGYTADVIDKNSDRATEKAERDRELSILRKRLIFSAVFLLILMYFSMGHSMWGFYLPAFLNESYIALTVIQLLLSGAILIINRKFFINGTKSIISLSPNMDALVAIGSGSAYIYSLWLFVEIIIEPSHTLYHGLYFESAAMVLTLVTLGKLLEAISKGRTTSALDALISLAPDTASVIRNGEEITVAVGELRKGDVFAVRPGERIPCDGVVEYGESSVDESALSGESIPIDKKIGDTVSAGTTNTYGYLRCIATDVGEDTTLSKIIKTVRDASESKAPIARIADKISAIFVPAVMAIALISLTVWLLCGFGISFALERAITVLVISCPCALGLATPVAIMVGNGVGARHGILFKTAEAIEECGRVKTVVMDKTGTLTEGKPSVTDVICDGDEYEFLSLAHSLEEKSEHPLAIAVNEYAREKGIPPAKTDGFRAVSGLGVVAEHGGESVIGGNLRFVAESAKVTEREIAIADSLSEQGKTPLFFAKGGKIIGIIAVADTVKPDSVYAVKELSRMGISTVMLSGDNKKTANAIASKLGIDKVIAEVLPDEKQKYIYEIMRDSKVAMVGDGINDSPALTAADVGIAVGAGSDIAIDSADIVLMRSAPSDIPNTVRLSRATLCNIKENLFWAFIYNTVGIPLAAGLWIPLTGWQLTPMFGALAMSLSSVCVVLNALRLNLFKFKSHQNINTSSEENSKMNTVKKTVKIEGMMCPHCSGRVRDSLIALKGVAAADVSHERGNAIIELSDDISNEAIINLITSIGYKVTGIE